jgi:hypothetical protein
VYIGVYYPPPPLWALSASDGASVVCLHWGDQGNNYQPDNVYYLNLEGVGGRLDGKPLTEMPISPSEPLEKYGLAQYINHPPPKKRPNVICVPFMWEKAIELFAQSLPSSQYMWRDETCSQINNPDSVLEAARNLLVSPSLAINPVARGNWFVDPVTAEIVTFESGYATEKLSAGCAFVLTHDINTDAAGDESSLVEDSDAGHSDSGDNNWAELLFDYKFPVGRKYKVPEWYQPVSYTWRNKYTPYP